MPLQPIAPQCDQSISQIHSRTVTIHITLHGCISNYLINSTSAHIRLFSVLQWCGRWFAWL